MNEIVDKWLEFRMSIVIIYETFAVVFFPSIAKLDTIHVNRIREMFTNFGKKKPKSM